MKYKIVQEDNLLHLEKEVNKLIEEGWKPQGGVIYHKLPDYVPVYMQAMVKE